MSVLGPAVKVLKLTTLGGNHGSRDVKAYGYGVPVKVDFVLGREARTAVLHTMTPGPFGHEHMAVAPENCCGSIRPSTAFRGTFVHSMYADSSRMAA